MRMRTIGTSGIEASVVGLGTWAMGGWMWGGTDEKASVAAIRAALDEGMNLIDTAPAYGLGKSEELVGKAIRGRRDEAVIATKCGLVWHTRQGNRFFEEAGKPVHRYLGGQSIRYELEQSLRRLGTDRIDLYQTHWQDPTTPIAETMGTLLDLKREGKIRAIGVSNVTPDELRRYLDAGQVDSIQEQYSLVHRDIETTLLPICREHGIAALSYSSLALGLLTGKIGPERVFEGDDLRRNDPRFSVENRRRLIPFFRELGAIADRLGLTVAQLVIARTGERPGITHVLCGAREAHQALENAKAGSTALTPEDIAAVDALAARYLDA